MAIVLLVRQFMVQEQELTRPNGNPEGGSLGPDVGITRVIQELQHAYFASSQVGHSFRQPPKNREAYSWWTLSTCRPAEGP
jgi:hypothetical protein